MSMALSELIFFYFPSNPIELKRDSTRDTVTVSMDEDDIAWYAGNARSKCINCFQLIFFNMEEVKWKSKFPVSERVNKLS